MTTTSVFKSTDNLITIRLGRTLDMPPLPFELNGIVAQETWEYRVRETNKLFLRSSKPIFERIWFGIAFTAMVVLPAALYGGIRATLDNEDFRYRFDDDDRVWKYRWEVRGITIGILVATVLVFWGPLVAWKCYGTKKAKAMARQWNEADAAAPTENNFRPIWSVRAPNLLSSYGSLTVTAPPATVIVSNFDPQMQTSLPSYLIQQPTQPSGYSFPYYSIDQAPVLDDKTNPGPMEHSPQPRSQGPAGERERNESVRRDDFEEVKV
ncbi:uncharacterized protein EI90DRAFT_3069576 [Cantharellus anzutake]|uniref:uncharacterized protein n=1 Tax=Cantharellus anzutake TaxID=1750568 RepID=UPI0019031752|nr:uncharacterized protein EI90DRAFT_3069576 [Cantharellus anzutake]KAF8326541.1 hypothetical protein EI90DRAFT_3069576 [Cantharellus anzutake]